VWDLFILEIKMILFETGVIFNTPSLQVFDKYLHFKFITCCTVDGDLSIALYSDNILFAARKFGDGLLDTAPLH